ncbi:hypothetical protein EJ110_NYTH26579 [Nymphaea thermarum]|nr:hypothetical protein EJ110_NYTH26579 [Nymphaea thermarum]
MGGEKRSSRGGPGGFRSKWKKLFSGKSSSAVEPHQDGLDEEKLEFESHMMEDEKRSECSCVSSLSIDDEGAGAKAPNVVARLMGLESLPSADLTESISTPFYSSMPTRGPKKSLQFGPQYLNFHSGRQPTMETLSGKMVESSPQKLQKMAKIERFQTETLPMKPVKSYSDIQHKLLSPIKSSGFVSAKSAAHLMETAVKILEPRLHPPAKNKSSTIGSSSISLNDGRQVEDRVSSYRICKPIEIPKKLNEPNSVKYLKGQAMNKSWNGPEDGPSSRVSSERRLLKDLSSSLLGQSTVESNQKLPFSSVKKERQVVLPQDFPNAADNKPAGAKGQGKSVSLALQAKVNVQKRENCSSTMTSWLVQDERDDPALSRQRKNQLNIQKNKQKQATSGATNVLRQNNQKQNRLPKPGDQLARKDVIGNISSRQKLANPEGVRNCTISSRTNSSSQTRKAGSFRASEKSMDRRDAEKGSCPKGSNDFPRKKRLIEGSFNSEKNGLVETAFVNGDKTNQDADVTTNSFLNQVEFKRQSLQTVEQAVSSSNKGTDVVSFTFTSPLAAISRYRPSNQALDRQDKKKSCFRDSYGGKSDSSTKSSMSLEGDALSVLLERKLRELTSGIQNADGLKTANSGSANTLSILQDFLSTLNSGGPILKEHDAASSSVPQESSLNHVYIARADGSSSSSQAVNKDLRFQVKEMEEQRFGTQREHLSKVDPADEKEHLSPVSILEAAYSNDSYSSFDSSDAVHGKEKNQSHHQFVCFILVDNNSLYVLF